MCFFCRIRLKASTAAAVLAITLCLTVFGYAQSPGELSSLLEASGTFRPAQQESLRQELKRHAAVLEAQSAVVRLVAELVSPTVVHIEADISSREDTRYGRGMRVEEAGSGVIVQWGGKYYVLTNRHVIRSAAPQEIKLHLADGRCLNPLKVLDDADTDVAVLPVEAPDLAAAPLGDSDRLRIGDFVLAVGSPFGLSRSVTFGIISAKGRRDLRLGATSIRFQDFLQTDAAINPGNSGGPLVNLQGEVIGINTAIASNSGGNEGIGFAIPINMFMTVARQLVERGKASRAYLGVNLNSRFTSAMAAELGLPRLIGAHVTGITPNSPAQAANLKPGDVILQFDRTIIENDAHLVNLVGLSEVGRKVRLLVFRERKAIWVEVELAERGKFEP